MTDFKRIKVENQIIDDVDLLTFLTFLYKKLPVLWQFFVFY